MDPRRACWESSTEDVTRPLLPVHDDDRRPAGAGRSCSALWSVLANKYLAVASGPLACALLCVLGGDLGGHPAARNMLGVLAWVFLWWITDAVPLGVASMAPLFLFPAFGISSADAAAKAYMDDVISLVLGSFILALAIEHYGIHRRLALNITSLFCGDPVKPHLLLLGICGTTVFISMWIHNTPCTVMMIQVATGILQRFPRDQLAEGGADARELQRFSKALVLGIMYASTIGGMATLTGTGANIILVGMWSTYFPEQRPITFSSWMSFGLPMTLVLFVALWVTLCLKYCTKNTGRVLSAYLDRNHLRRELSLMGPMAFAEKMVLAVFGALIVLWMTRSLTDDIPGWAVLFDGRVGDGTVTIMMTTLLFIIPSGKNDGEKLMDWGKCRKLQWHIILLLGAGFAIADGFKSSGLTDILSLGLGYLKGAPALAIAPVACIFSGLITEFTSDDATTTLVLPLLAELGKSIGVHPLLLMVPGTVGAQLSYLLPTATPGNVVGFGTGYITIKDMVVAFGGNDERRITPQPQPQPRPDPPAAPTAPPSATNLNPSGAIQALPATQPSCDAAKGKGPATLSPHASPFFLGEISGHSKTMRWADVEVSSDYNSDEDSSPELAPSYCEVVCRGSSTGVPPDLAGPSTRPDPPSL